MSWYVLQCRTGQEDKIIRSCRQHISPNALEEVFSFRCERLWRTDGVWKLVEKEMFPGYVFLRAVVLTNCRRNWKRTGRS
ncbi:MAG: transcription termination/antitermination NusG family protein [Staphylococcus aureus]